MPTTITSAGITFNDATSLTSANITLANGAVTNAKIASNAVTVDKLGTTEQTRIAKAWVNFNGTTGVIRSSYNVSSVTKNSNGDYTVNFTNALADANYTISVSGNGGTANGGSYFGINTQLGGTGSTPTTTNCRFVTLNNASYTDLQYTTVQIFGN